MSETRGLIQRSLMRAGGVLRDTWLMIGATVVLILLLEAAYRLQAAVRHSSDGPASAPVAGVEPPNPFDSTAWAADYRRDHLSEEAVRWASYVYVRNPTFRGTYITVDSLGHRVTPLPPSNGGRAVRVFFLGGSTTFGWYQRADSTMPAEAARRMQALLGDSAHVEVTNFGVPGHTFMQEILELELQLRAGARPDVVVFYDGINDVMATVQNQRAGLPQNEANRVDDFARGRALAAESPSGMANDLRVARRSLLSVLGRLHLARRIIEAKRPQAPPSLPADSLAQSLVRVFAENARIVDALAVRYEFEPIYVWQPALLSTRKPVTRREDWLRRPQRIADLHMAVPKYIGAAMAPVAGGRFIDATDLFHDDKREIFADVYGHTYERANPRVVDTLMPSLTAALVRVAARAHRK
jgi:hypothetical protein